MYMCGCIPRSRYVQFGNNSFGRREQNRRVQQTEQTANVIRNDDVNYYNSITIIEI